MKKTNKTHHTIRFNEMGEKVDFEIPTYAMYFNTGVVTCENEIKLVALVWKLRDKYMERPKAREALIMDLDDKIKVVNRLINKGVWV